MKKKRKWLLPAICYGVAILFYLLLCVFYLARDTVGISSGEMEQQHLWLEDFELISIRQLETEDGVQRFVSTDADPQMIYEQSNSFRAGRIVFTAKAVNKPSGSMVLYYKTQVSEDFSEQNKIWAKRDSEGNWFFDLRGKRVVAFRLDPDSTGGVIWNVQRITLNQRVPIVEYFIPDWYAVFAILFLPALAAGVLSEMVAVSAPYFARRKFDERWKEKEKQQKDNQQK